VEASLNRAEQDHDRPFRVRRTRRSSTTAPPSEKRKAQGLRPKVKA